MASRMASSLEFPSIPATKGPDGRYGRAGLKITCATCGIEEIITTTNINAARAPDFIRKRFLAKGWTVGKFRDADHCPSCTGRNINKSSEPTESDVKKPTLGLPGTPVLTVVPPTPAMSIDDKRVIFAKLDAVYIDGEKGYSDGWDDARVAVDLGCNKDWVTAVRTENFGKLETLVKPPSALEIEVQHLRDEVVMVREEALSLRGMLAEQAKANRTVMESARKAVTDATTAVEASSRIGVQPEAFNQVVAELRNQIALITDAQNTEIMEVRGQLNILIDAIHEITRQQRAARRRAATAKKF